MKKFVARTTMPKRGKLVTAYNRDGEEFRKYCLRYGTIENVKDWTDPVDGKAWRRYLVLIDGVRSSIHMKAGEVTRHGYGLVTDPDPC